MQRVSETPDASALVDERKSMSYKELDAMATDIAAMFPVKSPSFVGIVMDHSVEMIATIFAVLKSGAAYVPAEPSFPVDRTNYMMREANVDFVITNKQYAERTQGFKQLYVEQGQTFVHEQAIISDIAKPEDVAYVLYTSGTTGRPKGVTVKNSNVTHYTRAFENEMHIGPGDVMMQHSVCSFDIFVEEVFASLLNGATLAIPSQHTKDDMTRLMQFVDEHRVTIISSFPYLLLDMNKLTELPKSLRLLVSGGDVIRGSYITNLIDKVEIYNTYGPSETTVCASYLRLNDAPVLADGTYSIGRAVKGVHIEILDDDLQPVADGQTGEICIFGDGISRGYLRECPESSNFTHTADGRRVYRSGDLGYIMPDGNIAFLHRKDKQVMIMGKRVECDEVESVLCDLPEVERGAVSAYTDPVGLSYLVAYIVPQSNKLSVASIKKKLSRNLTPFMIPEFFVTLQRMPMTTNGKIDRRALPVILKEAAV